MSHYPSAEPAKPITNTINNGNYSFDNEETERRYTEAKKGVQQVGVIQRVKNGTLQLLRSMKGDFPELANDKRFIKAREELRMLGRKRAAQVHKAMKTFTENLKYLNTRQLDLFGRMRLLDDLMWRKQQVPNAELPFGFTDEMLKKEHAKFSKIVKSDTAVQKAIEAEEKTMREISKEFVNLAGQLGLKLDDSFKNPHYFRHSILEYASTAAVGKRSSESTSIQADDSLQEIVDKELNNIRNRSWLKRYKGSKLDIYSDYVMAMSEVRSQMLMDIETMKTLIEIKKEHDIAPRLRERIKQAFRQAQDGVERHHQTEGVNLSDIIPEGYEIYNPVGGRLIQSANSPMENALAMAIDDASEKTGIPLDEILATYGLNDNEIFNQLWVIPKEIKETLKKMSKRRDRGIVGNTAKTLTTWWKKAVLYSPTRNLRYNLRNFSGDLDAIIAGNPGALRFFPQAIRELTAHYRNKGTSKDLQDYLDRSGGLNIESMNLTEQDIANLQELAEQTDKNNSVPKKAWDAVKKFFARECRQNID